MWIIEQRLQAPKNLKRQAGNHGALELELELRAQEGSPPLLTPFLPGPPVEDEGLCAVCAQRPTDSSSPSPVAPV